jgi:hypothetical protein
MMQIWNGTLSNFKIQQDASGLLGKTPVANCQQAVVTVNSML